MSNKTKSTWHQIDSLLRELERYNDTLKNGAALYNIGQICDLWFMVEHLLRREKAVVVIVLTQMIKANPKVYAYVSIKPKEDPYHDGAWALKHGKTLSYTWLAYYAKKDRLFALPPDGIPF